MWTSAFHVLFTITDFVFCKSWCPAVFAWSGQGVLLKFAQVISKFPIRSSCPTSCLFVLEVEISSCNLHPLLRPGSVQWLSETTVTECSLTICVWARFLIGSHTLPGQRHSRPLRLRWVKGICVFRFNLPSALLAECPGSFTCHCGNTGVERTPNKSQHTRLTLEKKILPPLLPVLELTTFRSRVRRSNQQATPAVKKHDVEWTGNRKINDKGGILATEKSWKVIFWSHPDKREGLLALKSHH